MQINMQEREITVKVVYYGPALSGKTTNLQQLHTLINTDALNNFLAPKRSSIHPAGICINV